MNSILSQNDNLEAKLTSKYQSVSIASARAFDTNNLPRFDVFT